MIKDVQLGKTVYTIDKDEFWRHDTPKYVMSVKTILCAYKEKMVLHSYNFIGISTFDIRDINDPKIFDSKEEAEVYLKDINGD